MCHANLGTALYADLLLALFFASTELTVSAGTCFHPYAIIICDYIPEGVYFNNMCLATYAYT